MKFKVNVVGDKEISRLLREMPKRKEAEVKAEIGDVALKIHARAKANLKSQQTNDTGHLSSTILAELSPTKIEAEIGPTALYGPYVELGTKPFWPKPEALETWARKHGFDSTWPICKVISERGLPARPYLTPAYEDFVGELLTRLKEVLEKKLD